MNFFLHVYTIQINHFLSLYYVTIFNIYLNISHQHEKLVDAKSFKV